MRAALAAACLAGAIASVDIYVSQARLTAAFAHADRTCPSTLPDLRAAGSPLNPSTLREMSIAICLTLTGHAGDAERLMARVAREQPGNAQPWAALARIQLNRRRPAAARASWARVRQLNPHVSPQLPGPF